MKSPCKTSAQGQNRTADTGIFNPVNLAANVGDSRQLTIDWAANGSAPRGSRAHARRCPFERFREKWLAHANGCHVWTAAVNSKGYPSFGPGGRSVSVSAHRWAVENLGGRVIPTGMTVDHLCRNPRCVNPVHLEIVTREENNRRFWAHLTDTERAARMTAVSHSRITINGRLTNRRKAAA